MTNKRGQIPWKIIGVILALAVLAIFIYALATGTNPLFGGIESFGGGKVNVQQTIRSCEQACLTHSEFDYCNKVRYVVEQKGLDKKAYTCHTLQNKSLGLDNCVNIDPQACSVKSTASLEAAVKPAKP